MFDQKYAAQKINKIVISNLFCNIDKIVNDMLKNNYLLCKSNIIEANVKSKINSRFTRKEKMGMNGKVIKL